MRLHTYIAVSMPTRATDYEGQGSALRCFAPKKETLIGRMLHVRVKAREGEGRALSRGAGERMHGGEQTRSQWWVVHSSGGRGGNRGTLDCACACPLSNCGACAQPCRPADSLWALGRLSPKRRLGPVHARAAHRRKPHRMLAVQWRRTVEATGHKIRFTLGPARAVPYACALWLAKQITSDWQQRGRSVCVLATSKILARARILLLRLFSY